MKTFGSVIESLIIDIKEAKKKVYKQSFGTPSYFHDLSLESNIAFEKWAKRNGFSAKEVYYAIKKHIEAYKDPTWTNALSSLFEAIPKEFNVRGIWEGR